MKKVAGTLRLDIASYNELASFAQFGSDLDEATQAKLARGQRTMEVLKQGLHEPQTVSQQVVTLFALSHGFIDKIPLADVQRYESELAAYMHANHQDLYDSIQKTGKLPEGDDLLNAVADFTKSFQTSDDQQKAAEK